MNKEHDLVHPYKNYNLIEIETPGCVYLIMLKVSDLWSCVKVKFNPVSCVLLFFSWTVVFRTGQPVLFYLRFYYTEGTVACKSHTMLMGLDHEQVFFFFFK